MIFLLQSRGSMKQHYPVTKICWLRASIVGFHRAGLESRILSGRQWTLLSLYRRQHSTSSPKLCVQRGWRPLSIRPFRYDRLFHFRRHPFPDHRQIAAHTIKSMWRRGQLLLLPHSLDPSSWRLGPKHRETIMSENPALSKVLQLAEDKEEKTSVCLLLTTDILPFGPYMYIRHNRRLVLQGLDDYFLNTDCIVTLIWIISYLVWLIQAKIEQPLETEVTHWLLTSFPQPLSKPWDA